MHPIRPVATEPERLEFLLPRGVTMAFRCIPAGRFRMGSRGVSADEEPLREVRIAEPFWLAETPVTQRQFSVWTTSERVAHQNEFGDPPRPENPAETMNWWEANAFCAWLRRTIPSDPRNKLPSGFDLFCLPTEAEWEYACRAGTETDYATGDGDAALVEAGWFGEEWGVGSTHPVGQKRPNGFGLFDMHGNVWEWCHDLYLEDRGRSEMDGDEDAGRATRTEDWRVGLPAKSSSTDDRLRVLRGGSWDFTARICRSAFRLGRRPVGRYRYFGFRVCLVRGPAAKGGARKRKRLAKTSPGSGVGGRGTRPETYEAGDVGAGVDLARAKFPRAAGSKK